MNEPYKEELKELRTKFSLAPDQPHSQGQRLGGQIKDDHRIDNVE